MSKDNEGKRLPANVQGDNNRASWRFSADALNTNTAHYEAEARELLRWSFTWCIDPRHSIHWDDFCKRIGYASNTLWKIFNGQHKHPQTGERMGPTDKMLDALRNFRAIEIERQKLGQTRFVETPTSKKVWRACKLARESQTPVFVWGPSHIGKTWALEEFQRLNNHGRTIYVRMKAASGLGGMIAAIARAVGVSDRAEKSKMLDRIINALTPDTLLIIDELHELMYTYRKESFFACLEVIREIYDRVQCGLVLCGTNLAREKIEGSKHGELEQLMRRGVHRFQLPASPKVADITAIVGELYGLEMPGTKDELTFKLGRVAITEKPYEVLRQLAKQEGLKAITERLRYGKKLADKAEELLGWEHVMQAHAIINSESADASEQEDWL